MLPEATHSLLLTIEALLAHVPRYCRSQLAQVELIDSLLPVTQRWMHIIDSDNQESEQRGSLIESKGWSGPQSFRVNGKLNVFTALKRYLEWCVIFCRIDGLETACSVVQDCATIDLDGLMKLDYQPVLDSKIGSEWQTSGYSTTKTDLATKDTLMLTFEPQTAMIRNVFIRRTQGASLMTKLGITSPESMAILGTGKA